ncbi:hypothetical protein FOA52_009720 [Chlamydomonas sp. UWO 241]|nr:hypothetical protein FOA52_009720 [Chlamydomonas sp. UWO 241]
MSSIPAKCRTPGYTNMGLYCQNLGTFWTIFVPTESLDGSTCDPTFFKSSIMLRCHADCAKILSSDWVNTGKTCYLPVSTQGLGSQSCAPGDRGPTWATGPIAGRCLPSSGDCFPNSNHSDSNAGLCYKSCGDHYYGLATICWEKCSNTQVDCGAGCAKTSEDCGLSVFNQVFSVVVAVANIATAGGVGQVKDALDAAKTTVKTAYQAAFREEFVAMTSQDIYDQLNRHFDTVTRDYIINEWALIEADQMAAALGWMIADVALTVGALLDPTGAIQIAASYAKPLCLEGVL